MWTRLWISRPHRILDDHGVCGLCRALTPPKHHRGAREGSGPGTGSSWWRDGVDERRWRRKTDERGETEEREEQEEDKREEIRSGGAVGAEERRGERREAWGAGL